MKQKRGWKSILKDVEYYFNYMYDISKNLRTIKTLIYTDLM